MPTIALLNQTGEVVSQVELNPEVFGITPNQQVIYDVVNAQRAAMRQGTHDTKRRDEVRGGGRKPWRQKGTGRARQGSIRSPQWRGGGVVFGPHPRSYAVKVNRKVRRLALRSALSYKVANSKLIAIDSLIVNEPKTKEFITILNAMKIEGKVLFLLPEVSENIQRAARNLPKVHVTAHHNASVYDILCFDKLVISADSIKYFEEVLLSGKQ